MKSITKCLVAPIALVISACVSAQTAQLIVTSPPDLAGMYAAVTYDAAPSNVTSTTPLPLGELFLYDGVDCKKHILSKPISGSGAGKVAFLTGVYPESCTYFDDIVRELQADGVTAVVFGFSNGTWKTTILHGNPEGLTVPVLYMQVDEVSEAIRSAIVNGRRVEVSFAAVPGMALKSWVNWSLAGQTRSFSGVPYGTPSDGASWDLATFDIDRSIAGVQHSFAYPADSACSGITFDWDATLHLLTATVPASSAFNGSCSKTYLVRDTSGYQGIGSATLYVGVPYVRNDAAQTTPGIPISIDVLANDSGDASTKVAARIDLLPTTSAIDQLVTAPNGTWRVVGDGVNFLPPADYIGFASISYEVRGANGGSSNTATITVGVGVGNVAEYYHAGLDHYFITWMPKEMAILDAGTQIRGWTRTGYSFKTYTTPQAGTSPVCRYYIPPGLGDSHFFGRGTVECNATGQKNPTFVLEDPAFMQMYLPNGGICPAATTPIYRVFSNRPDANHRYMTDRAVRDQMVAKGWLAEGDGPDLVVMCAPQ